MKKIVTTRLVQERGQVTIPQAIRNIAKWLAPSLPVSISLEEPNHVSIEPHRHQQVDWDTLWGEIEASRLLVSKGKGKGSLSAFIAADRYRH